LRLLDLYCGAGGSAVGYYRAGFTQIVGIDINPQKHYPFEFIQRDALTFLQDYFLEDWPEEYKWTYKPFQLIHASPPCQKFSSLRSKKEVDLIEETRVLLKEIGIPYIIENVPQAPLIDPIQLCGGFFNLGASGYYLKRHRHFESNLKLTGTPCNHFEKYAISVHGGGAWNNKDRSKIRGGYKGSKKECEEAMGIDWMNRNELAQAIPPSYTEFLGKQVLCYNDKYGRH